MHTSLLQDWITVSGHDAFGGTIVAQSAHQYVDIAQFEDLVFYLDVRKYSGGAQISYETSPTRQDSSFLAMIAPITLAAVGLRVDRAMFSTAAVPPARYVRWKATSGIAWSATFRIWFTAYAFC